MDFFYQRKKIKNMNLRVNRNLEIVLSIPMRHPINKAKDFIVQKYGWIQRQQIVLLKYVEEQETEVFNDGDLLYLLGEKYVIKLVKDKSNKVTVGEENVEIHIKERYFESKNYIKKTYEEWLKKFAIPIFGEQVQKYQLIMKNEKIIFPDVEVRKMRRRWGCCFPNVGKVVFNLNLIKVPMECIEYVVIHELAHFKYANHSRNFYDLVEKYMPEWKKRKMILDKEYSVII